MKISNSISIISFLLYNLLASFFSSIENNNFKYSKFVLLQKADKYKTIGFIKILFSIKYFLLYIKNVILYINKRIFLWHSSVFSLI